MSDFSFKGRSPTRPSGSNISDSHNPVCFARCIIGRQKWDRAKSKQKPLQVSHTARQRRPSRRRHSAATWGDCAQVEPGCLQCDRRPAGDGAEGGRSRFGTGRDGGHAAAGYCTSRQQHKRHRGTTENRPPLSVWGWVTERERWTCQVESSFVCMEPK